MSRWHVMELVQVDESGARVWACRDCARRLSVGPAITAKPVVLVAGDESAWHVDKRVVDRLQQASDTVQQSGLSQIWLEAIRSLDMSGLPGPG